MGLVPGRAVPAGRAVSRAEKKSFVFSESDHIRTLSYSRGVFLPSFCAPKLLFFFIEHEIFINRKKKMRFMKFYEILWGTKT